MPIGKRWKFGDIEVLSSNLALPMKELMHYWRVETETQFVGYLRNWLREPQYRPAALAMYREFTASAADLSRISSSQVDQTIVSALSGAFQSGRFHVLRRAGTAVPTAPAVSAEDGKRWRIGDSQVVSAELAIPMNELLSYIRVESPAQIGVQIARWMLSTETRARLLDVFRSTAPDVAKKTDLRSREAEKTVAATLQTLFEAGKLHLLKLKIASGGGDDDLDGNGSGGSGRSGGGGSGSGGGRNPSRGSEKTWIEIRLIDQDDQPVPGIKYRLKITDGSVREGALDAEGKIRVTGIDPGTCEISFPELDSNDWKQA